MKRCRAFTLTAVPVTGLVNNTGVGWTALSTNGTPPDGRRAQARAVDASTRGGTGVESFYERFGYTIVAVTPARSGSPPATTATS